MPVMGGTGREDVDGSGSERVGQPVEGGQAEYTRQELGESLAVVEREQRSRRVEQVVGQGRNQKLKKICKP